MDRSITNNDLQYCVERMKACGEEVSLDEVRIGLVKLIHKVRVHVDYLFPLRRDFTDAEAIILFVECSKDKRQGMPVEQVRVMRAVEFIHESVQVRGGV